MKGINKMYELWLALFFSCSVLMGMAWFGANVNPSAVTIASDFVEHLLVNSVAPTQLSVLNIPANTVTGLQALRYEVTGQVRNNTGGAQNAPLINLSMNGIILWNGPVVTSLPASIVNYFYTVVVTISPSNGSITSLMSEATFRLTTENTPAAPLIQNVDFRFPAYDPTQNNQLTVTVTQPVANAQYTTTVDRAQVQIF